MDTRRGNGTDDRAPETLRKGLGQIRTKGRGKDAKGPGKVPEVGRMVGLR